MNNCVIYYLRPQYFVYSKKSLKNTKNCLTYKGFFNIMANVFLQCNENAAIEKEVYSI